MTRLRPALLTLPFALMPALASAGGSISYAEWAGVQANWQLHSDDSYLASRAGCYEMLTHISQDVTVEPMLATGWTQTSPTTWDFTLREGVTFQDGTPLTAEAVAHSLNFLLEAPVPTRAFSKKTIAKVEATGPMTVTITTLTNLVSLPGRLAAPATAILSGAAYKDGTVSPMGTCSGPFRITAIDPEQGMKLEANPTYWGGKPALDAAEVRFIPDANTRNAMSRSGEVQIARMVPPYAVAKVKGDNSVVVHELKAPRIAELLLNNARAPFNDERVRQAVKLAVDTAALSAAAYEDLAPPAGSPFRPEEPWAPKATPVVTPDLEKAKALLKEAGVENLNVELLAYTARKEFKDVSEVIQAMLGEIGINVTVRMAEYAAIEPDLEGGNFEMALMSHGYLTDAPDPGGFLAADYSCKGSYNISHFCDQAMDDRIAAATSDANDATRFAAYADIAQTLYDKAVTVYLVNEPIFDIAAASLTNYQPHPLNYYVMTPKLGAGTN